MADYDQSKPEEFDLNDISSLLNTIDSLLSVSGHMEAIDSQTIPLSKLKLNELKEAGFTETQLEEISKGLKADLPVEIYAKKEYNWMQMYEIRMGLMERLDPEIYASPLYSANQMHEIRLGMLNHLDVSSYANLVLSATDMQTLRKMLFAKAYKANPTKFARTFTDDETGILIRISKDCMQAFLMLPANVSEDLSLSDLFRVLDNHEIVYGLIEDNIRRIAQTRPVNQEILIAQGKPPITGKPGWYELFFENCIEKGHTVPPDGEIDYTDVNTIDVVNPGDKLAKYHPAQKDTEGITVTGITVEGITGGNLPRLTGVGFELDDASGIYYATAKGYASYNDSTSSLNVWNVYHVQGDVCYYQSVEFDGTIHVSGSVRSMATLRAKGDIIIDGFVENANVYSDQNIVIKGGANGGGQGRIEAGGSVRANFFENIDVTAKGMVESNYYFNSNITTEDRMIARGRKARIIGGRICAALSVDAVIVGNYLSSKTLFNVGDIHSMKRNITTLSATRKGVLDELDQLAMGKQKLTLLLGESQVTGNPLYVKTCNAIHTKELQMQDLDREIDRIHTVMKRAEKAYIKIHGHLQADVTIIINNIRKETPTITSRSIMLTKMDCIKSRQQAKNSPQK